MLLLLTHVATNPELCQTVDGLLALAEIDRRIRRRLDQLRQPVWDFRPSRFAASPAFALPVRLRILLLAIGVAKLWTLRYGVPSSP